MKKALGGDTNTVHWL